MTSPYLLDSSYLIALETASDQWHPAAAEHWRGLVGTAHPLVTTSLVLGEVVAFFKSRRQHDKAIRIGNYVMRGEFNLFVLVDHSLLDAGWTYLGNHHDKTYSLTDCVSFVLMQRLGLSTALTFDHHFTQAGFRTLP